MGQKEHPYGFRLGIIRESKSKWFAEGGQYTKQLIEDIKIRKYILDVHRNASIADLHIERAADTLTVSISTAKPGIIIGKGGQDVDELRKTLEKMVGQKVRVNVEETKDPDINAQLVAENIARQIERRVSYRRAMKQAVDRAMRLGAQGIRMAISGRLGGAEIARSEAVGPEGRVPLHTLRADVEYGVAEAKTGYGNIGVKVWIYKGDILPPKKKTQVVAEPDVVVEAGPVEEAPMVEEVAPAAPAAPAPEAAVAAPDAEPTTAPAPLDAVPAAVERIETDAADEDLLIAAMEDADEDAGDAGSEEEN